MIKRKKGMSHLELIVGILIFIFAVVSVIYFINLKTATPIIISESHLDILESGLRKEAELDFNKTVLYIRNIPNAVCFSVSKHSTLENQDFVFITTDINQPVAFEFSGNDLLLIENTGEDLYKIYSFSADVIDENPLGSLSCYPLLEGDYDYSIVYRDKIFTQKNLSYLKNEYNNNYESLKEDFGLSNKDFSIIVKNEETGLVEIEMTKLKSAAVEVQAREFSAEIVKEDGTIIKNCRINIQIW